MKIKDVEKQVGISKANIRFYEEEGLIHPARNQENNYREYSETDVEQLQEIKKLRLIGIPVQEIKDIYENRLTLQEALSHRLDEIEKEERTLKETKLTCQKALKSKLDITSIDQLEIEEEKEEWQVRLAILLKEDIVQKKLSRDEMNNEIACFFIAGTILSVISIWLLPKDYIGTHLYVCRADFTCSCGRSADHRNMFGEYESASDIVASGGSCTACRTFYNRNSDGKRIYCVS